MGDLNPPDGDIDPTGEVLSQGSRQGPENLGTFRMSSLSLWAAALVCVIAASFWVSDHQDLPFIFLSGDERNYSEIGRRIATNRGFTTGVIYPIEVEWGVDDDHPSLLRPPLWPLLLAASYSVAPVEERTAHLLVGLCFMITCLLAYAIGARLHGPLVGLIAGATSAATPTFSQFAMIAGTEMLLALWIALATLLIIRKSNPFWIGAVCGLAYLTRYNAGVLLVAGLLFLPPSRPRWKPYALCLAGFLVAGAPWWIRNAMVTGEPFFSLYTATLWAGPGVLPGAVLHMLDPPGVSLTHPLIRGYSVLAEALTLWPLAAANLVAFAGLFLGCLYWSRPHLFVASAFLMTKIAVTLVIINNRYLMPFAPAMIALGSAAWILYGGRVGRILLVCVLFMPFITTIPLPPEIAGVGLLDAVREHTRTHGEEQTLAKLGATQFSDCMNEETLVIAHDATAVVWAIDNVAIQMPRSEEDFWELTNTYPVEFVISRNPPGLESGRFEEVFRPRPDCGPHIFERRVR